MPTAFQVNMEMELESFLHIYWYRNLSLTSELKLKEIAIISVQFAHNSFNYIQADTLVKKASLTFTNSLSGTTPLLFIS